MKKSLTTRLSGCAWQFVVAIALAAVMPAFAGSVVDKNVAPAPPPPCDWNGFYLGVNAGITNFEPKFTDLDYFEGYDTRTFDSTSFIGGGQIGYNWQRDMLVLGIEIDADGSTADVNTFSNFTRNNNFQEDHAKIDLVGTARLRMGIAFQNALVFVTGGGAYAHGKWSETYGSTNGGVNTSWTGSDSRYGWAGGGGIEYMLSCHWSVRTEVLYTHLEPNTVNAQSTTSRDRLFRYEFSDDLLSLRLGINYKF